MEKVVIIIASLAFAALVSCANSPDNEPATASQVISFIVDAEQLSRQPIEGADMPDDQQIVVGAWNTVSGDYFYNSTFTKNAADGTWQEVKIWPVNGITSFLSYTHRPRTPRNYIIPGDASSAILVMDSKKITWGIANRERAKRLVFSFGDQSLYYNSGVATTPDDKLPESIFTPYVDLLYANADQAKEFDFTPLKMTFKHTGAWLLFNVKAAALPEGEWLKINNFHITNIHKGGTLTIDNTITGGAVALWDFTSSPAADYAVECFPQAADDVVDKGVTLTDTYKTFGVVIPEQNQTAFKLRCSLKTGTGDIKTTTYTYNLDRFQKWEMGKKYVYNITVNFNETNIETNVKNWTVTPGGE